MNTWQTNNLMLFLFSKRSNRIHQGRKHNAMNSNCGEVLNCQMVFLIIGEGLLEFSIFFLSDVIRIYGPKRFSLIQFFLINVLLINLLCPLRWIPPSSIVGFSSSFLSFLFSPLSYSASSSLISFSALLSKFKVKG